MNIIPNIPLHATIHLYMWETLIPQAHQRVILDVNGSFQKYIQNGYAAWAALPKADTNRRSKAVQTMVIRYVFHAIFGIPTKSTTLDVPTKPYPSMASMATESVVSYLTSYATMTTGNVSMATSESLHSSFIGKLLLTPAFCLLLESSPVSLFYLILQVLQQQPIIFADCEGATGRSVPLPDRVNLLADRAMIFGVGASMVSLKYTLQ